MFGKYILDSVLILKNDQFLRFYVYLGYGLTLGFPTIVIPSLKSSTTNTDGNFNLTDEEISWFSEYLFIKYFFRIFYKMLFFFAFFLGSINLLCVPLGCFFSGIFTDPTGKKRAMQVGYFQY